MSENVTPTPCEQLPTTVDELEVDGLVAFGGTNQEICDYLKLTNAQLEAQHGTLLRRRRAWSRLNVRRRQYRMATKSGGDRQMLQWLGRTYLGQGSSAVGGQPPASWVKEYVGIDPELVQMVRYQPLGTARDLFMCREPEILVSGPAGTGKTRAALEKVYLCMGRYPGMRTLLVRKTRASLSHSVLVTLEDKVILPGHPMLRGPSRMYRQVYTHPNASQLVVAGMDNVDRIMSSYDIPCRTPKISTVESGIARVESRLLENRLWVFDRCKALVMEAGRYQYLGAEAGGEKAGLTRPGRDHAMDALRYLVAGMEQTSEFQYPATPAGAAPETPAPAEGQTGKTLSGMANLRQAAGITGDAKQEVVLDRLELWRRRREFERIWGPE